MKIKSKLLILPVSLLFACGNKTITQIAENTFVYKSKVYKVVDNELTEIANLNADSIRTLGVLKPRKKELGTAGLDYVKPGAEAIVDALYRGNFLYYKVTIKGLNDLKENYRSGSFTIEFQDEFGFMLHSLEIPTHYLVGIIDDKGRIVCFEFKNKVEISTEINTAIKAISISSTVKKKDNDY